MNPRTHLAPFPPFAAVLISLHAASGGSWAEEARRLEKYKRGAHDQFGIDRSAHGIATDARQSTRGHDVSHTDSMRVDPRGDEDVDATAKLVEQGLMEEDEFGSHHAFGLGAKDANDAVPSSAGETPQHHTLRRAEIDFESC